MKTVIALVLTVALMTSCASLTYSAPASVERPEMSVVVDADFSDTWTRVIELLAVSFYDIDLLDRDSGFIRLDFTASDPTTYVNCGTISEKPSMFSFSGAQPYSGPHADYLATRLSARLSARMNVLVKPMSETQTMVRVHARYVFGKYVFETGGSDTRAVWISGVKTQFRTCRPTHVAEANILRWAMGLDE